MVQHVRAHLAIPLMLAAALLGACALAAPGGAPLAEMVVTDAAGRQLVGFGVVENGRLTLQLGTEGQSLVLVLIDSQGSVATLPASRGPDGGLVVELPDGTRQALDAYLGGQDISLEVVAPSGHDASGGASAAAGQPAHGNSADHPSSAEHGSPSGSKGGSGGLDVHLPPLPQVGSHGL
ncbi:MAG TPA: hypothetical protein VKB31_05720 [Trueperaceae bacterium]|nr:hypothetical protein [Trueperaceae bacterium]